MARIGGRFARRATALGVAGMGVAGLGALVLGTALWMSGVAAVSDAPLTVTPPDAANWALAAPASVGTAAAPSRTVPVFVSAPDRVLAAFDAAALAEPRVRRLDDGSDPTYRAYVQRSRVFRFPDVISARTLDLGDGRASLAVYSRSMVGSYDWGVNADRLARWLDALERSMRDRP